MSFVTISNTERDSRGATTLPNQPTISATALKQEFDAPAKEVVVPKFNQLVSELEATTAASSLGASAPTGYIGSTVQGVLNDLASAIDSADSDIATLLSETHTHSNKSELDKFSEDASGKPLYDGNAIGETDYDALDNQPQINSVTLTGNKSASDLGLVAPTDLGAVATSNDYNDLNNLPTIPTKTSDLTNDSNYATTSDVATAVATKSNVAWNQQITTGQKIAIVTIDGTPTDVYAPTGGGGGGGGAVDSVNGQTGTVILGVNDIADVTITSITPNDVLIRDSSGWKNSQLADVAYSNDYTDLSNTPTNVSDFTNDSGYQTSSDVATAISGKEDKSALKDLAYIAKDGVGSTKLLQGDGTWVNPSSDYDMIDNSTYLSTMKANSQDPTDDKVASTYAISNWSNAEIVTLYTTIAKDTDTVGKWEDDPTWKNYDPTTDDPTVYRDGWLFHKALYKVISDDEVEIEVVFDIKDSEAVNVYAYRVDDEVYMPYTPSGDPSALGLYELSGSTYVLTTDTTVVSGKTYYIGGGAVAIKLNGPIQTVGGVKIGINLKRQRTMVDNLIVI